MRVSDPALLRALDEIPGWFPRIDQRMFCWFLERQERLDVVGDLLELGVYHGKSAVLIGYYRCEGQVFTVCDLFDTAASDAANDKEMRTEYANLARDAFEKNYLAFHDQLPEIIAEPSALILQHVKPGSCRFVHVDASHLYNHVHRDIAAARTVLLPGGIAVCDDYRAEHTPGVAAAVWEAVAKTGLNPICVTPQKLYGTWDDPSAIQDELLGWLDGDSGYWHEVQDLGGRRLIRLREPRPPKAPPELHAELARVKAALERERKTRKAREQQLRDIRRSVSYRVGRILTAAPRRLRRFTSWSR